MMMYTGVQIVLSIVAVRLETPVSVQVAATRSTMWPGAGRLRRRCWSTSRSLRSSPPTITTSTTHLTTGAQSKPGWEISVQLHAKLAGLCRGQSARGSSVMTGAAMCLLRACTALRTAACLPVLVISQRHSFIPCRCCCRHGWCLCRALQIASEGRLFKSFMV